MKNRIEMIGLVELRSQLATFLARRLKASHVFAFGGRCLGKGTCFSLRCLLSDQRDSSFLGLESQLSFIPPRVVDAKKTSL